VENTVGVEVEVLGALRPTAAAACAGGDSGQDLFEMATAA
jgi:hypothetical protein